jgi:plastocyanin
MQIGVALGAAILFAACSTGGGGTTATLPASAAAGPTTAATAGPPTPSATPEPVPEVCADPCALGIVNVAFHPATRHVAVGTTITWQNMDPTTHTVTFLNGEIDSLDMAPGALFPHTFDAVGTFAYHCKIHLDMLGTVIVTP